LPTTYLADVTVVIPLGPGERAWRDLIADLSCLSDRAELLLVATDPKPADLESTLQQAKLRCAARWIESAPGRARQLNRGAALAGREFLWFLHGDSRLGDAAVPALARRLDDPADALHYFDLKFQSDGPLLMWCNELGVRLRSRWLRLPFGDQGFCLRRSTFIDLGQFDETAPYGEDHLLVWAARRHGLPIRCVGVSLKTSARKYAKHGWLRTTTSHVWRTFCQAAAQWVRRR
jgi:hypothetical protein